MKQQMLIVLLLTCISLVTGCSGQDTLAPPGELQSDKLLPNLRVFSRKLFPYHDGKAWGYMDVSGTTVIPPSFDNPGDFFDDIAVVRKNEKEGFLNSGGSFLEIPENYRTVHRVSNSRAMVTQRQGTPSIFAGHVERFTYIDLNGTPITEAWYDLAGDFSEGLARVNKGASGYRGNVKGGQWGYIDTSGKEVIGLEFEDAGDFYEGLARVKKGGKWGFIDRHGHLQVNTKYGYSGDFSEGLAYVRNNRQYSYIDKNGETKIPGPYDVAYEFSEGRAVVTYNAGPGGEMFYIDHDGKEVISKPLDAAMAFSDGLACVRSGRKWGFINLDGIMVIPPQFDDKARFVGGIAAVTMQRSTHIYIDKNNKTVRQWQ